MREQTVHTPSVGRREDHGSCCDRGVGGPIWGVMDRRRVNVSFFCVLILTVTLAGGCRSGPPEQAVKPSEGFEGLFPVIAEIRNLGDGCVVVAGGSKWVVVPLVESTLERWFRDSAGGMSEGRGDSVVVCRTFMM